MDLIKIRKSENKTEYSIDHNIDAYIDVSYTDIINIANLVTQKESYREHFKLEIETRNGEYSFNDLSKLNKEEYLKFMEEGIERLRIKVYSYSCREDDYLDFLLCIRKNYVISVSIQTFDEVFARGLYSQIISYITNIETWYSCIFKAIKRFELISLFIVMFIGIFISSLHSMGIRYRYIIVLLGMNAFVVLASIIEKFSFIHKTNFLFLKKKSSIFAYLKNPRFWQHVINTIVTVILTTLANIYFLKH